jgi:hypothetical protein
MRELHTYHEDADLDDDAVIVCLDWRGMRTGRAGIDDSDVVKRPDS